MDKMYHRLFCWTEIRLECSSSICSRTSINKVDLAPASLVAAWVRRFRQRFPAIQVVCFSSCPMTDEELEAKEANEFAPGKNMLKKRMKRAISDAGPRQLVEG